MLFYREEVPIAEAEKHARAMMGGFDNLPRKTRDQLNQAEPPTKRRTFRRREPYSTCWSWTARMCGLCR